MKSLIRMICLFALMTTAGRVQAGLINGDFQTGDLTGWTTFTTANGTIGTPAVASFDTTGSGASLAARFNVGELSFNTTQQGGGIFQSVVVSSLGDYHLSVDIASASGALSNGSAGVFSLLLDGVTIDSNNFGGISGLTTLRSSLSKTVTLGPGTYEFRVLMTRPFVNSSNTPNQYLDNAKFDLVSASTVPEPASIAIWGFGALGYCFVARRKKNIA